MATLKKISDYAQVSTVLGNEKVLVEKAAGGYGFIESTDLITNDWTSISNKPTTLTGYGITDAASFPTQTGQSGKFLTTDGSVVSWGTPAGGGGGSGDTAATPNTLAQRDSNGDLYAVNFISTSDIAVKTNISAIVNPLDIICNLVGHQYRVKGTNQDSYGFLAQEIERVLPNVVHENDGFKSVNYTAIIGILVEAVKDLTQKVVKLSG